MKEIAHYVQGVVGRELTVDTPRAGYIDDGLIAFPERVATARRYWPETTSADFEKLDRRRYRDRASGHIFRRERGCGPLLSPTTEVVDAWFIESGSIVLLVRDDRRETTATVVHGHFGGYKVVDGRLIPEGS
jgi:hypothetical protein